MHEKPPNIPALPQLFMQRPQVDNCLNMVSQTLYKSWYIATSIIFLDIIHPLVEVYLLDPTEQVLPENRERIHSLKRLCYQKETRRWIMFKNIMLVTKNIIIALTLACNPRWFEIFRIYTTEVMLFMFISVKNQYSHTFYGAVPTVFEL